MNTELYDTLKANDCWRSVITIKQLREQMMRCLDRKPLNQTAEFELTYYIKKCQERGLYLNTLSLTNGTIHFAAFKHKRNDVTNMVFHVDAKRCVSVYAEDDLVWLDVFPTLDDTVVEEPIAAFKLEQGEDDLFHYWRTECMIEAGKL